MQLVKHAFSKPWLVHTTVIREYFEVYCNITLQYFFLSRTCNCVDYLHVRISSCSTWYLPTQWITVYYYKQLNNCRFLTLSLRFDKSLTELKKKINLLEVKHRTEKEERSHFHQLTVKPEVSRDKLTYSLWLLY